MTSTSFTQALIKLGLNLHGGNHKTLRKLVIDESLDISHFKLTITPEFKAPARSLESVLQLNTYYNSADLRKRLIKEGLLELRCYTKNCIITTEWLGLPVTLQLDHINGDHFDNRLENLRILCPMCHSQTRTFCGGNRSKPKKKCYTCYNVLKWKTKTGLCSTCVKLASRKPNRPSLETLISQILEFGFVATGKLHGVSDNAIRKWLLVYGYKDKIRRLSSTGRAPVS